jgi:putative methyltransferase (TIGR04325 family)
VLKSKAKAKTIAKDLLLPTIRKLTKRKKLSIVYSSYEEALKHADGFDDPLLTKVVVAKGKKFAENLVIHKTIDLMMLRTVIGIVSVLKSKSLKVIDFGGAAGAHYFITKSLLDNDINIDWRVIETPAMVNEAVKQGLQNNELTFYDTIEAAAQDEAFDLVFASSSVHYTPRPYDVIASLLSVTSKKFVLTRTAIANQQQVLLQKSTLSGNGIGPIPEELGIKDKTITYPVTVLCKEKVEGILRNFGEIQLHIKEDKKVLHTAAESFGYYGYIVTKHSDKKT